MSWDADLVGKRGKHIAEWNYTHNTSKMIYAVIQDAQDVLGNEWLQKYKDYRWYQILSLHTPNTALLEIIITGLEANPPRFIAMNPDNKWGNYHQLLSVLKEMHNTALKHPKAKWETGG